MKPLPPLVTIVVSALLVFQTTCSATAPSSTAPLDEATFVERSARVVEIVVEGPYACARTTDGRVACWGLDVSMQQAPDCPNRPGARCSFVPLVSGMTQPQWVRGLCDARSLAIGGFAAAIRETGEVVAWDTGMDETVEPRAIVGLSGATQIALGLLSGCAARQNGDMWCWGGRDRFRTLEDMGWEEALRLDGIDDVIHVDADLDTMCAVTASGTAACWGQGQGGVLGPGMRDVQNIEDPHVVPLIDDALEVFTGDSMTCVRRRGGTVTCWGDAAPASGRLSTLAGVLQLSVGQGRACAVLRIGNIACWGETPFEPEAFELDDVSQVALGSGMACVVRSSGEVACRAPTSVLPAQMGVEDVVHVAPGHITCALHGSGRVSCWGQEEGASPVQIALPPSDLE